MVAFLFGVSVALNVVFVCLWAYGMYMDRRFKREAKRLLNTQRVSTNMYKNWMFEACLQ